MSNIATAPRFGVAFQTQEGLAALRQTATMFSVSSFVKAQELRGGSEFAINNAMILAAMAQDYGMPVYALFNSVYFVHGVPSFSAQFFISRFNLTGQFSRISYDLSGKGDDMGCVASCIELATKEKLVGSRVTIRMARESNWSQIWYKLPEQMLRYRAATFLIRSVAPEVLLGMHTVDEERDIIASKSAGSPASVEDYKEEAIEVAPQPEAPTAPQLSIEEQFRQLCIFGSYDCEAIISFTIEAYGKKGISKTPEDCMKLFLAQPQLLERAQKQVASRAHEHKATENGKAPVTNGNEGSKEEITKKDAKVSSPKSQPENPAEWEAFIKGGDKLCFEIEPVEGDPYSTAQMAFIFKDRDTEGKAVLVLYSKEWNNHQEQWVKEVSIDTIKNTLHFLDGRKWKLLPSDTPSPNV